MDGNRVLIAGAGPVGMITALALAQALAQAGVPVTVFDSLPDVAADHRASTLYPSTLGMVADHRAFLRNAARYTMLEEAHAID